MMPEEAEAMMRAAFPDDVDCRIDFLPKPALTTSWVAIRDGSPRGWSQISYSFPLDILRMDGSMFARYAEHLAEVILTGERRPIPEDIEEWGMAWDAKKHPPAPQRTLDSLLEVSP